MASIFPEKLPEYVLQDPMRSAERKVYQALAQLPDTFTVFYSVAWVGKNYGSTVDGEADFVIAHPDLGILILEVKGGGIEYDAGQGSWTSTNRYGDTFSIKDPTGQARKSKHALLTKLKELSAWGTRRVTLGHAVVFPDVDSPKYPLKVDLPTRLVVDRGKLDSMTSAIEDIYAYWQEEDKSAGKLGVDGLQMTTNLLASSFKLRTTLGVELDYDDARIVELTQDQMRMLDFLARHRRAAIQGCAGSGKTMLAMEKARRLAEQGFDVLLTCFNVALAEHMAKGMPDNVTILHFHGLCKMLIEEAEIRAVPPRDTQEYFNVFLPNLMLDAVEDLGPQFDAIVVDEGQDFQDDWWLGMMALLREPEQGVFYVFFDDNQNLYRGRDRIPGVIDQPPYPLTENCRNTQSIHRVVAQYHPHGQEIRCRGPQGRDPDWIAYTSAQDMLQKIRKMLHHLINEDGVAATDLVILTPRAEDRSELKEGLALGNFVLTRRKPTRSNQIAVTTVQAFKGLEGKVVLFAELDHWAHRDLPMLLYVGCSRARTMLVLFHDQQIDLSLTTSTGG